MNYIKYNTDTRTDEWIIKERPTAFLLLILIARRAKRTLNHIDKSLEIGEAKIGDYESYGATEQIYRSDKEFLISNGLITTKTTNKGTIAKLISSDIFDIQEEKITDKLSKINGQLTTNNIEHKNINNKKKDTRIIKKELTVLELWEVAKHFKVHFDYVKSKYEAILDSIENGDKYKVVSLRGTLSNWVRMGIERGNTEKLDGLEWEIEMDDHEPSRVEKREKAKLKIKEDEKNGKPIFDFTKFRKQ